MCDKSENYFGPLNSWQEILVSTVIKVWLILTTTGRPVEKTRKPLGNVNGFIKINSDGNMKTLFL